MNSKEIKNTERLIERFFNGDTSLAEERRLYRTFLRRSLPPELEKYRSVFRGFASMSAGNGHKARLMPVIRRAVCASAVALVLILGVSAYLNYNEDRMLARVYGGSYIIENGRRIDDLSRIKTDIEAVLLDAERIEARVAQSSPVEQAEQDVLNSIGDPAERQRIMKLLK